jgi:hypothetical protein
MPLPTVTDIVRQTCNTTLRSIFSEVKPDQVFDLKMDPKLRTSYMRAPDRELGNEFHKALARGVRGEWVPHRYWPFVYVILAWMESEGVTRTHSEWKFGRSKQLNGRCDAVIEGGVNKKGVLEYKLTGKIPDADALPEAHLAELSLYACAAVETDASTNHSSQWGAVVYICPSERTLRIFQFTNMTACGEAANRVLKAAA